MLEKERSLGILIEWDEPVPPRPIVLNNRSDTWAKRLAPMKRHPGRRARILKGFQTSKKAEGQKANIVGAMLKADSYDHWKIEIHKDSDSGGWGIWATYVGRYTEAEYLEREAQRIKRGNEVKANLRSAHLRKREKLQRSAMSGALRPPVYQGD